MVSKWFQKDKFVKVTKKKERKKKNWFVTNIFFISTRSYKALVWLTVEWSGSEEEGKMILKTTLEPNDSKNFLFKNAQERLYNQYCASVAQPANKIIETFDSNGITEVL